MTNDERTPLEQDLEFIEQAILESSSRLIEQLGCVTPPLIAQRLVDRLTRRNEVGAIERCEHLTDDDVETGLLVWCTWAPDRLMCGDCSFDEHLTQARSALIKRPLCSLCPREARRVAVVRLGGPGVTLVVALLCPTHAGAAK